MSMNMIRKVWKRWKLGAYGDRTFKEAVNFQMFVQAELDGYFAILFTKETR